MTDTPTLEEKARKSVNNVLHSPYRNGGDLVAFEDLLPSCQADLLTAAFTTALTEAYERGQRDVASSLDALCVAGQNLNSISDDPYRRGKRAGFSDVRFHIAALPVTPEKEGGE